MKYPRLTFQASSIPLYFEELDYPSPPRDDWPRYAPDDEGYGWIAGSLITENGESNFYLARGEGDLNEVTEIPGIGLLINAGGCCHIATAESIRALPYPWGGWIDTRVTPEGTVALCHHVSALVVRPDGTIVRIEPGHCDLHNIEALTESAISLRGNFHTNGELEVKKFHISIKNSADLLQYSPRNRGRSK